MSRTISFELSGIHGTGAAVGRTAEGRSIVVDRPRGAAGGSGLGFNGAELLGASLGGCFWNDLHYAAQSAGSRCLVESVDVRIDLAGEPLRVVRARVAARLVGDDPSASARIFETARAGSTIANSLAPAFPIAFELRTG
jgi:organic hydroperoxide reductase OsmC/OhrA